MAGIWYRTGTVALTNGSKRVNGTGTTWLDQAVGPVMGNTFWGPDNKPYEVERVVSNTALDLVEAYAGTTVASTPYKINTTEKFSVASLASQVAATLQYAQAQYSNMSLWASGDLPADVPVVLPDGVSAKDVPNVAKMQSLIAAKLTETAQLKALDVPSSAFGRARLADANAAAQRTALSLKKAALVDILGTLTVPDASGLTGAIIERGSNANGEYTKLADGTMRCRRTTGALDPGASGGQTFSHAAVFVGAPMFALSCTADAGTGVVAAGASESSISGVMCFDTASKAKLANGVHINVSGNWF